MREGIGGGRRIWTAPAGRSRRLVRDEKKTGPELMAKQVARPIAEALYEARERSESEMSAKSSENVAAESAQSRVRDSQRELECEAAHAASRFDAPFFVVQFEPMRTAHVLLERYSVGSTPYIARNAREKLLRLM